MSLLIQTVGLAGILLVACWTDLRSHRIPNVLVLIALAAGLVLQLALGGLSALGFGVAGVFAGFLVFLFPYLRGGMAAGDVKLIAACGAFLGPVGAVLAGGLATIFGALIGSALIALHRRHNGSLTIEQMLTTKFPFALSIALGVAVVLSLRGYL
jgi:prepilin peptidase CpaA